MNCLSSEQLAQLAIGGEKDAKAMSHIQCCEQCRASLSQMQSLDTELVGNFRTMNDKHNQSRVQLLAKLQTVECKPVPNTVWNKLSSWIQGLDMKQQIALSSITVTMILGLTLSWSAFMTKSASAVEKMGENIRKAKSYQVKMLNEIQVPKKPGQKAQKFVISGIYSWLAPGTIRMDVKGGRNINHLNVYHKSKPGIEIDHIRKTFSSASPRSGKSSPLMILERLGQYSGKADRKLESKIINGRKVSGFVIDSKKIDPDIPAGPIEIWLDNQTNLPSEILITMQDGQYPMNIRMVDFEWNLEFKPNFFEPTPPKNYTDATPKPLSLEKQVRLMSAPLKLYADLSKGHYPRVEIIYGDVTRDQMKKMIDPNMPVKERHKLELQIMEVTHGLAMINAILRDNPDAAYYGRNVGPLDKGKVLLRWKREDGNYHIIYGDLQDETVTANRLRKLEVE